MITCRVLGPVDVTVDDRPPPAELLWRKNLALLIYLARSPKRSRTRAHLIGLLWADKSESLARRSLNSALHVVRRCAGKGALRTRADQVALDARAVALDTDAFEQRVAAEDWRGAGELVSGEFLEGFAVPGASEFENWLTAERSTWRRRSVDALVRLAEASLAAGDVRQGAEAAGRALALDATSDAAARALMRGQAVAGDRGGALETFEAFSARLAQELNTRPDPQTIALAERVRRERSWGAPRPAARETAADSRRAPLVGRSVELARLLDVWRQCRDQPRAAVVFIEGEVGAGKSRLADEFATRARLDGAAVATVRAVEWDLGEPESALVGLARGGLLAAPGLAAAPSVALAAVAARDTEWADHFPSARPGAEVRALGPALSEILRAVTAECPVVLVLDDAHWVDRESLLGLGATVRDLVRAPLYLVCTTTPRSVRPELEALRTRVRRDLLGVTVGLAPLGADDLRALARWALPRYTDAEVDRVCRRIGTDSAGLPLLAVELFHAVALGLDLKTAPVAWPESTRTFEDSLPGDLPDSVVGAIRVGFRRLSQTTQQVLATAAVLAGRVTARAMQRATGLSEDEVTRALDELEWQRWLTFDPRGYAFVARIVRQVVERDMVLPGMRQRILQASGA